MTDPEAVLSRTVEPALREAAAELSAAIRAEDGFGADDRARLARRLAEASEAAQAALGDRARDARIHRIVGAAASGSMALSLGDLVPLAEVLARLESGLGEGAAGSWPPEDQDPAD